MSGQGCADAREAPCRCPQPSTLDKVRKLSRGDGYIAKSSLLIVGALVKNSRGCTAAEKTNAHAQLDAMQTEINDVFHKALKEARCVGSVWLHGGCVWGVGWWVGCVLLPLFIHCSLPLINSSTTHHCNAQQSLCSDRIARSRSAAAAHDRAPWVVCRLL